MVRASNGTVLAPKDERKRQRLSPDAGSYTAMVCGKNDTSGVGWVEVCHMG